MASQNALDDIVVFKSNQDPAHRAVLEDQREQQSRQKEEHIQLLVLFNILQFFPRRLLCDRRTFFTENSHFSNPSFFYICTICISRSIILCIDDLKVMVIVSLIVHIVNMVFTFA